MQTAEQGKRACQQTPFVWLGAVAVVCRIRRHMRQNQIHGTAITAQQTFEPSHSTKRQTTKPDYMLYLATPVKRSAYNAATLLPTTDMALRDKTNTYRLMRQHQD